MFVLYLSVLGPPGVEPNPTFTSFALFMDGAWQWNFRSVRSGSISGLCLCRGARNPSGSEPTSIRALDHRTLAGIPPANRSPYGRRFKCSQVLSLLSFGGRFTVNTVPRIFSFHFATSTLTALLSDNQPRWHEKQASGGRRGRPNGDRAQKKNRRPTCACKGPTPRTCVLLRS